MVMETGGWCIGGQDHMMGGYGMFGISPIYLNVLLFAALIVILYWLFKGDKKKETPMEILQRRLAAGEITPEEFQTLKKELGET